MAEFKYFQHQMNPNTQRLTHSGIFILKIVFALLIYLYPEKTVPQSFFATKAITGFYKFGFNSSICACENCCELELIAPTMAFSDGIAMDSLENVLGIAIASDIYKIDTIDGTYSIYFDIPIPNLNIQGFASNGGSIFYIMITPEISNTVYRINVTTGTMVNLGESPILFMEI